MHATVVIHRFIAGTVFGQDIEEIIRAWLKIRNSQCMISFKPILTRLDIGGASAIHDDRARRFIGLPGHGKGPGCHQGHLNITDDRAHPVNRCRRFHIQTWIPSGKRSSVNDRYRTVSVYRRSGCRQNRALKLPIGNLSQRDSLP